VLWVVQVLRPVKIGAGVWPRRLGSACPAPNYLP